MKTVEFCKKYKKELVLTGLVIGGAVIGALITKRLVTKNLIDLKGKSMISWTDNDNGFMNLEKVKEILDANANNSEAYAIFREGPSPDEYIAIAIGKPIKP
jgi:preprotein translocase subunit SecF